jgi:hypothetical protein
VAVLVAGVVIGAFMITPAGAHVTDSFKHLWNKHIKPKLANPGTINASGNPVDWTKLKGVPSGFADGTDDVGDVNIDQFAPIMRADSPASGSVANSGAVTVNSLSITAPVVGFLVITGSATVNNNEGGAAAFPNGTGYLLLPRVDGGAVANGGASSSLGPDAVGGNFDVAEIDTLTYTVAVAVNAGTHSVNQTLGPDPGDVANADFSWARASLVVQFIPGDRGSIG